MEPCSREATWRGKFERRRACCSSENSEMVSVVSQTLHAAEHLKGLLRYLAELVPALMSLKEELVINKILWCWNMALQEAGVNVPPASTCPCGSVHKAHGVITPRWSCCISLNLNTAFSLLFLAEDRGCGLILGTPWLLSVGVTVGMLFQSNFFYLKVFMWADKALSLYPKVSCSTLVLQITLTCSGAATQWTGNQFSPPFSAWSFMVDNGDVCVMLLTDLRMHSIKRLKGISS